MKKLSVNDRQLVATLKRNRQRYKAELSSARRSGNNELVAELQAKLGETEELIQNFESESAAVPRSANAQERRRSLRPSSQGERSGVVAKPLRRLDAELPGISRSDTLNRLCDLAHRLRQNKPLNGSEEARERGLCRIKALRAMGWEIEFDKYENTYVLLFAPPPRYF